VLKERFTRRSVSGQSLETSLEPPKALRMSIGDYQRLKQTGTAASRLNASHNDYQRRRSVSPFTNRRDHSYPINSNAYIHPPVTAKAAIQPLSKYSRDTSSNLLDTIQTKSIYTKNHIRKHFSNSDDLVDPGNKKSKKKNLNQI